LFEGLLCAKQSEENTMLARTSKAVGWIGVAGVCVSVFCTQAMGARYADVLGYYEPGQNVDAVFGSSPIELFDNAQAALGGPGEQVVLSQGTLAEIVSLGGWTDDPATGTNSRTPGIVVGFSVQVLNVPGDDLLIVGNAPAAFTFYEPGFVEVAVESDGGGATPGGWQDETFYLLKPGNFAQITDPRTANNTITITSNPDFSLNYSIPFDDDANLPGYFDVTPGGDGFDLADAIDLAGNPVALTGIAYVRMRSASDSAFPFGTSIAPDVDYIEVLGISGDLNGDGFVGVDDLNTVLVNWNQNVAPGDQLSGDLTGEGFVGVDDLNIVLVNWNAGTPPTSGDQTVIPEPGTLLVLAVSASCLICRRRA
jgi:hypothetical protein